MVKKIFEFIYNNIPNGVTLSRGILGPIMLPILFFSGNIWGTIIATIALASTDLIDGPIARFMGKESNFGKKADIICDKILGFAALSLCCIANPIMFSTIALELITIAFGMGRYKHEKEEAKVVPIGKVKTVSLFAMVGLALLNILFPILLIPKIMLFIITSVLQIANINENVKKLVNKEEVINTNKTEENIKKEEEKLEEPGIGIKSKYLALRDKINYLVKLKEENERRLGKEITKRILKK